MHFQNSRYRGHRRLNCVLGIFPHNYYFFFLIDLIMSGYVCSFFCFRLPFIIVNYNLQPELKKMASILGCFYTAGGGVGSSVFVIRVLVTGCK